MAEISSLPLPGIARTLKYRLPTSEKSSIEIKTKQENLKTFDPEDRLTFEEITSALRIDKYALEEFGMKTDFDQLHEYQNRIDTD